MVGYVSVQNRKNTLENANIAYYSINLVLIILFIIKNINKIIEEHLKLIDEFKKDPSLEVEGDDFVSTFNSGCERIKVGLRESIFHGRWLKFY